MDKLLRVIIESLSHIYRISKIHRVAGYGYFSYLDLSCQAGGITGLHIPVKVAIILYDCYANEVSSKIVEDI
jgi:hypothetical protein